MTEHQWIFHGQPLETAPEEYQGFVYLIENHDTKRKYIGKKFFWSTRKVRQKGKTTRKTVKKESDWKKYYGSNKELLNDIADGKNNVTRTILHLCHTKGECSYLEAKEQFERDVLLTDDYYNTWISAKIAVSHLKMKGE